LLQQANYLQGDVYYVGCKEYVEIFEIVNKLNSEHCESKDSFTNFKYLVTTKTDLVNQMCNALESLEI